jgi:site-specific DNA-methyltransferase (adenine-specific)
MPTSLGGKDWRIIHGDCLEVLRTLPDASVDAVITDPPYSSGGLFRGDRMVSTETKYIQSGCEGRFPSFSGDNRDQRSWAYWCQLWLSQCLRVCKPSGYLLLFSDWRQLPTASDSIQAAGWVWRGLVPWDKTEGARAPHTGYFRHQCEYVVWGTKGVCRKATHGGPWPGCFRFSVKYSDKWHQAGKPTLLLRELVRCVSPGGTILDPFMGSGTTGVASLQAGYGFVGVEADLSAYQVADVRLAGFAYTPGRRA